MKNIHILPTDKPSRLFYNVGGALLFTNYENHNGVNIYITNSEEIKEGVDQCYLDKFLNKPRNSSGSQYGEKQNVIILTTDQDLIKDGVQAIDYDFLEWFVKNPSCEDVDIKKGYKNPNSKSFLSEVYKIYVPIEKFKIVKDPQISNFNKQETLEEVAERFTTFCTWGCKKSFIEGAKWQMERSYSEEEVKRLAFDFYYDMSYKMGVPTNLISENATNVDVWFKQLKKK